MMWYTKWKAKRELRKSAKLIHRICDEMPDSFFTNLVFNLAGHPLDPLGARNVLSAAAQRIERKL